jgi:hypothetical protein
MVKINLMMFYQSDHYWLNQRCCVTSKIWVRPILKATWQICRMTYWAESFRITPRRA